MMTALVLSPLTGQAVWVFAALARWIVWHRRLRALPGAVFVTLWTLIGAWLILGHNLGKPMHYGKGVYRQAACDLARQTPGDAVVMTDSTWIPYYMAQVDPQRQAVVKPDLALPAAKLWEVAARCRAGYVVLPPQKSSSLAGTEAAITDAGFLLWKQYVASDGEVLTVYTRPAGEAGE